VESGHDTNETDLLVEIGFENILVQALQRAMPERA